MIAQNRLFRHAMRPISPSVVLQGTELSALLITDLTNIQYLTGITASSGALLLTPRTALLYLDPRYLEEATQKVLPGVTPKPAPEIWFDMKRFERVGFESDNVTVTRLRGWKKRAPAVKWVRTQGLIEELRRQKDEKEILRLKRAERITKEMLRRVPGVLRRGLTEKELAWKLALWAHDLGADGLAFDPVVAFGTHTSHMHHHPTTRVLKKGHIVQIDVGAQFQGYHADMAEVFFTAEPTSAQQKAFEAVTEALEAALERVKVGARTAAIDAAARKVLKKRGMEETFQHALGHGVGLSVHEGPVISSMARSTRLLPGEVFAVEPGVYFPGQFGIRRERMVYLPWGEEA
jgi:Xaa-Pro aminopeptidase